MPSQLTLDLTLPPTLEEGEFFVASCNERALRFVRSWPDWPSHAAVVFGPPGCGKTHLAAIWQSRSGATSIPAYDLRGAAIDGRPAHVVVEDADRFLACENVLFHLLNVASEHGTSILLTSRLPPGLWPIALPDLRSRIRACPAIEICEPDDGLLSTVLLKHFSDRQLAVAPDVIPLLLSRMERSMDGARSLVSSLDRLALAEHRRVTRPFAAKILRETVQDAGLDAEAGADLSLI